MESNGIDKIIEIGGEKRRFIVTAAAKALLTQEVMHFALTFHNMGDWGEDYEVHSTYYDKHLKEDVRFLSVFRSENGTEYWVMTKDDKSVTILLPTDYVENWKPPCDEDAPE